MFIRSERVFLRPGWAEDWKEFSASMGGPAGVCSIASNAASQLMANHEPDARCPTFLITLPSLEGTKIIGFVGFFASGDDVGPQFWIAPQYRGKGYGSEALRAILCLARTLGHRRLVAQASPTESARIGVLENAGFRMESLATEEGANIYVRDLKNPVLNDSFGSRASSVHAA